MNESEMFQKRFIDAMLAYKSRQSVEFQEMIEKESQKALEEILNKSNKKKEMNKVVYNDSFGGFNLSVEGWKYLKDNGVDISKVDEFSLERHNPVLVRCIEELGKKASDGCYLKIEEIESDEYLIDDYDGKETVLERGDLLWAKIEKPLVKTLTHTLSENEEKSLATKSKIIANILAKFGERGDMQSEEQFVNFIALELIKEEIKFNMYMADMALSEEDLENTILIIKHGSAVK